MKNTIMQIYDNGAVNALIQHFSGLLNPNAYTPSFTEVFIESRDQFTASDAQSAVRGFGNAKALFDRLIEHCRKARITTQLERNDESFSFIRMILQEIIMKDDDSELFKYKQSMLYRYFELCTSLALTPSFNWDKEARFYRHVQAKFLTAVNRADLDVASHLIQQGIDLDARVGGSDASLLALLVRLREKSLRECKGSNEEAPRKNAVTYLKLLKMVLDKGVSLSTLFHDVTILDQLAFTSHQLIAYFARSVHSPDEVLDALRHLQSKEDLKYLKGWLLQSLHLTEVEYLFAVASNYLTMRDNMVLLGVLRTGRSTLEMKDTDSYVQFVEMMQKVQYKSGALLGHVYRHEEPKTVQLYEAYLRELSRSDDGLTALRQRLIEEDQPNMSAVLCYFMRAKSIELEPDQFQRFCVDIPLEALTQPAVKACLTAGFATGAHRSLKANLIAYLEQNLNNFRDRLQQELTLAHPTTWLFELLNLRASHFDRGNTTASYEKLRVMLDPDFKPQNRWLRFTYRPSVSDPRPVNAVELPHVPMN